MNEKYINLIKNFKQLDIDDKKQEIMNNTFELLKLLYLTNKKIDNYNELLPVLKDYQDEDEYYNQLFTYIISLKEENAKLIEQINNL